MKIDHPIKIISEHSMLEQIELMNKLISSLVPKKIRLFSSVPVSVSIPIPILNKLYSRNVFYRKLLNYFLEEILKKQ